MKKVIVIGIVALVVIGCVLAAGCTSTNSNGNASGHMISTDQYLDSELNQQLIFNIDDLLGDELRTRMASGQISQAEFAKVFGTTSEAYVEEILAKKINPVVGILHVAEMEKVLEEKFGDSEILIDENKLEDISKWSNEDLMKVIYVRVYLKERTVSF